jgi:NADH-quinone oxidoreductase subunit E
MSGEDTDDLPPVEGGAESSTSTMRFEGEVPSTADFFDPDDTASATQLDGPAPAHPNPAHAHLEFSQAAKDRIEWLRTRYPKDHQRALILPILSMAQREFGWVSAEVIHHVAAQIPVPPIQVEEVATFYTMYNKAPIGRWHLQVCHNISCALMGAEIVIEHISDRLGIQPGETTADGEFTLVGAECLGSCGTAPMMQVNDHYHENLSLQDVDDLLERLRATPDQAPDPKDLPHGPGSGPGRALPRDGAPLRAGHGIVVPHPGAHGHGPDPKARVAVHRRPQALDPDDKRGYTPQGMASP